VDTHPDYAANAPPARSYNRTQEHALRTPGLFDVLPAGFLYQPEFITTQEEGTLLARISSMQFGEVTFRGVTAKRRIRQFGWRYSFESFRVSEGAELPDFLLPLRDRAAALAAVDREALSEALVTEYPPGAPIGWHRDAPVFGIVVGVSLLAPCVFRLRRNDTGGEKPVNVELAPRSAYVLDGEARTQWQHSIPAVRTLRYSITFRTLRRPKGGSR
jgi:alkylated DNA repair dioxygenase AlkB